MASQDILREAQHIKSVSQRLELMAEEQSHITEALLTICETIRSTATILEVLVATRLGHSQPM